MEQTRNLPLWRRAVACLASLALAFALVPALVFTTAGDAWADDTSKTAIEATGGALESGSYYLADDVTLSSNLTVASGISATLDLAGYTLTGTSSGPAIKVASGGTLAITDSSDGETGAVVSSYDCLENSGTTTINGGTFTCTSSSNYAVINYAGTLTISETDAAVVVTGTKGAVGVEAGTVTIKGGTFTGTNYYALYVDSNATVIICGGIFDSTSKNCVFLNYAGKAALTIYGGTFEDSFGVNASSYAALYAMVVIYGGAFSMMDSTFAAWIADDCTSIFLYECATEDIWNAYPYVYVGTNAEIQALLDEFYRVYGAESAALFWVWAGTASFTGLYGLEFQLITTYDSNASVTINGVKLTESNSSFITLFSSTPADSSGATTTTYYSSLKDAIDGADAGATVSPLLDLELDAAVSVASDDSLTLDLAGQTLTVGSSVTGAVISSAGTLTITDSVGAGSLTAATDGTVVEATAGTVAITGGCYSGSLSEAGGSIEVSGGYFATAVGTGCLASGYSAATASAGSESCAIDTGTYGHTVSPVTASFKGGSLRMDNYATTDADGNTTYGTAAADLRFGYTLQSADEGVSLVGEEGEDADVSWGWSYRTYSGSKTFWLDGANYTASYDEDGGLASVTSNFVLSGVLAKRFSTLVYCQLQASYENDDGVKVTVTDDEQGRCVVTTSTDSNASSAVANLICAEYEGEDSTKDKSAAEYVYASALVSSLSTGSTADADE